MPGLPPTVAWLGGPDGTLYLLDQTQLPARVSFRACTHVEHVWEAIRSLGVRGAPAIGVAAAYGLCVATRPFRGLDRAAFLSRTVEAAAYLAGARPTAVNLAWAVERVQARAQQTPADSGADGAWRAMFAEAEAIAGQDADICRRIGQAGAHLVPRGGTVLTHCNAGALATAGRGTALALLYEAHERGVAFRVLVDETRPLLQGARLTAFELAAAGIEARLICDSAAASLMRLGQVQMVVVGADRVAANGDVANKIGTYAVALAARQHGVPFYVAAPLSTFDPRTPTGDAIPIEQRGAEEVRRAGGADVAAPSVACLNPAFDVTPAEFVRAIVTERGLVEPVDAATVRALLGPG
jgi:methylthioribose-1-phosphate isomerase